MAARAEFSATSLELASKKGAVKCAGVGCFDWCGSKGYGGERILGPVFLFLIFSPPRF